jgi:hypothetical protein
MLMRRAAWLFLTVLAVFGYVPIALFRIVVITWNRLCVFVVMWEGDAYTPEPLFKVLGGALIWHGVVRVPRWPSHANDATEEQNLAKRKKESAALQDAVQRGLETLLGKPERPKPPQERIQ